MSAKPIQVKEDDEGELCNCTKPLLKPSTLEGAEQDRLCWTCCGMIKHGDHFRHIVAFNNYIADMQEARDRYFKKHLMSEEYQHDIDWDEMTAEMKEINKVLVEESQKDPINKVKMQKILQRLQAKTRRYYILGEIEVNRALDRLKSV